MSINRKTRITCTTMTPNHCSLVIEDTNYNSVEFHYGNDSDKLNIWVSGYGLESDIMMGINQEDLKHLIQFLQLAVK